MGRAEKNRGGLMLKRYMSVLLVMELWILMFIVSAAYAQGRLRERLRERMGAKESERSGSEVGGEEGSLEWEGRTRTYQVHLPRGYDGRKSLSLVIVLHGGGAPVGSAERMSAMSPKADKEGFIAVYPNGTSALPKKFLTWNAWNCCAYALKHDVDDVGFIRALIEKLEKEYNIDPKRIYATGLSNGAIMSYRLGVELSDKIAAIAPVEGALNIDNPRPTNPVSVIIFHGTSDQHVLYNGGVAKKSWERAVNPTMKRVDRSVSYAVSFWVKHDQCAPNSKKEQYGHIVHEVYTGCRDGTGVEVYTVIGQGHAWPGGKNGLYYANVDPPTQEISATDLMWDFFTLHSKP